MNWEDFWEKTVRMAHIFLIVSLLSLFCLVLIGLTIQMTYFLERLPADWWL